MNKMVKWISTVSMLAMTLFLWSCDSVGDMTQPELSPAPMVVMSRSGKRYQVAVERDAGAGSVSKSIGSEGGMLQLGAHSLWVSRNAVSERTKFTITRDPESSLRVTLTAGRNSENDVGAAGFNAPVRLALSFVKAEDVPADKSSITILYFRPDGLVEELETTITVIGKTAVAELPHFSLFGLAWP